ncbi:MAG: hypothetical protein M0R50_06895 [Candidatus Cloacimonetes bacterium]|nr:hypothetical protein [Candidatus Cloacimonadota bacterium]
MKEFTNVRELIGQISLDLGVQAGKVGSSFRDNIRKGLEGLGDKKEISVSIKQTQNGSVISLTIEDWVEELERNRIIEEFKDLMDRIGATRSGSCNGAVPGTLVAFLR